MGSYGSLGQCDFEPLTDTDNTYQLNGDVTYTTGKHTFRGGAQVIRRQFTNYESWFPAGLFSINASNDFTTLYQFLQGGPIGEEWRNVSTYETQYREWEPGFYFDDDWRISDKLTLNLGRESEPNNARAVKLDPSLMDAHYRLGMDYSHIGRKDLAEAQLAIYQKLRAKHLVQADKQNAEIRKFTYAAKDAAIDTHR